MSAITYTFDLAAPQPAAQSAPAMSSDSAAAIEQSYLSASAPRDIAPPASVGQEAGPGVTTLAIGEEDGGGMSVPPQTGDMSAPAPDGDYQVTTLAIGEEDGGGMSSQAMSPVQDDHSIIGGQSVSSMGGGDLPEGYGQMQPIYSPGEAEYPAFAKTSQTTDILNFHHVPRSFTATVQQSMQPAPATTATTMAPIGTDTMQAAPPVAAAPLSQPVYATSEPAPVAMEPVAADAAYTAEPMMSQPVYATSEPAPTAMEPVVADTDYAAEPMVIEQPVEPTSGNYESVGTYESYVSGTSGSVTITPTETSASEPLAFEAPSSEAAYEQYQPAADMTAYDNAAPAAEAATVEAAAPNAPETSAEPAAKPPLFEKDTPFGSSGVEQAADPADGKPDYVAPAEGTTATAPKPEATYVNVPLDAYLVEPSANTGAAEAAPASEAASDTTQSPPTASEAPTETSAPAPETGVSMGGSFTVMDQALPSSLSSDSSSAAMPSSTAEPVAAGAEATETAPAAPAKDDLSITTLAIGEEDGGGS